MPRGSETPKHPVKVWAVENGRDWDDIARAATKKRRPRRPVNPHSIRLVAEGYRCPSYRFALLLQKVTGVPAVETMNFPYKKRSAA